MRTRRLMPWAFAMLTALAMSCVADSPEGPARPDSSTGNAPVAPPATPTVLVGPQQMLAQRVHVANGTAATGRRVALVDEPFDEALEVTVERNGHSFWDVETRIGLTGRVRAGDVLSVEFHLRAVEVQDRSGKAFVNVYVQQAGPPWEKSLLRQTQAGERWQRYTLPFVAKKDYAPGKAQLCFGFGHAPQTLQLAGVRLVNHGRAASVDDLPATPVTYAGRETDAAWRAEADARIDRIRKADLTVTVRDAHGNAIPDASVRVTQTRHAFRFGTAVAAPVLLADSADADQYRRTLTELFNAATIEQALKWRGDYGEDFSPAKTLRMLTWLNERGLAVRGHVAVWPSWKRMPPEAAELKDQPEQLRRLVAHRVTSAIGLTRGQVVEWDVVNEPFHNHDLMDVLGEDVIVEWFKLARQADPDIRLFINEYGILSTGGLDRTSQQDNYERLIRSLLDAGAPLDGIGMQCHFVGAPTPPEMLLTILDRFGKLGRPIVITEYDLDHPDRQLQADYMRDFMTTMFSHSSVKGFYVWGFWAGRHWKPHTAMFGKDWSLRPNGQVYKDLVFNTWWTDQTGETDAEGKVALRGFLGDYTIMARSGEHEYTLSTQLVSEGKTVTIMLSDLKPLRATVAPREPIEAESPTDDETPAARPQDEHGIDDQQ